MGTNISLNSRSSQIVSRNYSRDVSNHSMSANEVMSCQDSLILDEERCAW